MNLLIIKDKRPGHYNQSIGIAESFKVFNKSVNIEFIDIEIRSKFLRKVLTWIVNNFLQFGNDMYSFKYLKLFYKEYSLPQNIPEIIISTGGDTANINVWFSRTYKTKNIFNGRLRGQKENFFNIITTLIPLGYKNELILDIAPSLISKNKIEKYAQTFKKKNSLGNRYYTLLIGGDGAGYNYNKDFYNKLISFVKRISKKEKVKWLITTSRRTPLDVEKYLKNELSNCCDYFVDYNRNSQKVLMPFLGLGEIVFVTEDSSSMISEAVSAKKPVITLYSEKTKNKNYNLILNKFEKNRKIKRLSLNSNLDFDMDFLFPKEDYSIILANKLKDRLQDKI